ncbi:30S ribosome-binding factor RbfA [Candidatus Tisiphia endosymbiont of Beris chalybata]|uniref:30S ribosome-binding factor RbfA n=1 Tax=Candidatus Tisiphia endosymbiont of Beris chalybata TaxID=3066262 RepID=UPI00312CB5B9
MKISLDKTKAHKPQKVAMLINIAIAEILRRGKKLDESLIDCPVTITKVIVTSDLKLADCYFLPFNTNLSAKQLIEALNNSKYAIRHLVAIKVNLKYSPEIRFHYDYGFDNADKVEQLLKQ